MKYTHSKRVITLLIQLNELLIKITKLKIKNRQALGLLAETLQINKQMLFLLKSHKINPGFVKEIVVIIIAFVKDVISKWLFRYKLTPLKAIEINNLKLCLQLDS